MTDIENHITPNTVPDATPDTTPKKSKVGIGLLISLTLIMALTALFMNHQLAKALEKQTKNFDATLGMLVQQQSSTEARLQAYRAVTATHENRAKEARDMLEKKLTATLAEKNHVSDDWRLFKARYLLELAGLNAHWSTDKSSTIAMLSEANTILKPLHDPALTHVRQAITDDIHAIKSAPTADITALITQLHAASKSTWQLPHYPLPKTKTEPATASNFLTHLITIRHTETQLAPKPTIAFEAILRANIRLSLQEAAWAVLEKNNTVYQLALEQALHHLKQSFISDATQTKALIDTIQQLQQQQTTLNTTLVLSDKPLTRLNQVILSTENKTGAAS
jgi:uroporphyrin-3 C-methyltransferase